MSPKMIVSIVVRWLEEQILWIHKVYPWYTPVDLFSKHADAFLICQNSIDVDIYNNKIVPFWKGIYLE